MTTVRDSGRWSASGRCPDALQSIPWGGGRRLAVADLGEHVVEELVLVRDRPDDLRTKRTRRLSEMGAARPAPAPPPRRRRAAGRGAARGRTWRDAFQRSSRSALPLSTDGSSDWTCRTPRDWLPLC